MKEIKYLSDLLIGYFAFINAIVWLILLDSYTAFFGFFIISYMIHIFRELKIHIDIKFNSRKKQP